MSSPLQTEEPLCEFQFEAILGDELQRAAGIQLALGETRMDGWKGNSGSGETEDELLRWWVGMVDPERSKMSFRSRWWEMVGMNQCTYILKLTCFPECYASWPANKFR